MTLSEYVKISPGAALLFPNGVPQALPDSGFPIIGSDEISYCQREFFLKWCRDIPSIPMDELLNNDCIVWTSTIEVKAAWLPIWMCASIYAVEVLNDTLENTTMWAQNALQDCMMAKFSGIPLEAINYFVKVVCDTPEFQQEFYSILAQYLSEMQKDDSKST